MALRLGLPIGPTIGLATGPTMTPGLARIGGSGGTIARSLARSLALDWARASADPIRTTITAIAVTAPTLAGLIMFGSFQQIHPSRMQHARTRRDCTLTMRKGK